MSNSLFLHIGIHKTGTTAVQEFFWTNKCKLEEIGWCYPQAGLSGFTHAGFVNAVDFAKRKKNIRKIKPDFDFQYSPYVLKAGEDYTCFVNQLENRVSNKKASNYFMSSECFFEWTQPHYFADAFHQIFDQINVIIYLREQVSWLNSVYNQLIKDPYFKYSGAVLDLPQLSLLDYFEIINEWEKAFGEQSIIVKTYDSHVKENIVKNILETIGLDWTEDWDWQQIKRQNISLHPKLARMILELNKQELNPDIRERVLVDCGQISDEIDSHAPGSLLTHEEIQHVRSLCKRSNEKLFEKYGTAFVE